jgi:hypothetical protein
MAKIDIHVGRTRLDALNFARHRVTYHRVHQLRLTQIRALHIQLAHESVFAVVSQII